MTDTYVISVRKYTPLGALADAFVQALPKNTPYDVGEGCIGKYPTVFIGPTEMLGGGFDEPHIWLEVRMADGNYLHDQNTGRNFEISEHTPLAGLTRTDITSIIRRVAREQPKN